MASDTTSTYTFQPRRLTMAREAQGYTKKELARAIGKTPSAVSQFESGGTHPGPLTICELADVLRRPVAYFMRPPVVTFELGSTHFRKKSKTTVRDQRRSMSRAAEAVQLVRFLEAHDVLPEFRRDLLSVPSVRDGDGEALADGLRDVLLLGTGPIEDVAGLLDWLGIPVIYLELTTRDIDAFTIWDDNRPLIFVNRQSGTTSARFRLSLLHELKHIIADRYAMGGEKAREKEADAFAGAFLMPRVSFLPEWPPRINWAYMERLKRRWKASYQAMLYRARAHGAISDPAYRRAHMVINKHGWRDHGQPAEPPFERSQLLVNAFERLGPPWTPDRVASELCLSPDLLASFLPPQRQEVPIE